MFIFIYDQEQMKRNIYPKTKLKDFDEDQTFKDIFITYSEQVRVMMKGFTGFALLNRYTLQLLLETVGCISVGFHTSSRSMLR